MALQDFIPDDELRRRRMMGLPESRPSLSQQTEQFFERNPIPASPIDAVRRQFASTEPVRAQDLAPSSKLVQDATRRFFEARRGVERAKAQAEQDQAGSLRQRVLMRLLGPVAFKALTGAGTDLSSTNQLIERLVDQQLEARRAQREGRAQEELIGAEGDVRVAELEHDDQQALATATVQAEEINRQRLTDLLNAEEAAQQMEIRGRQEERDQATHERAMQESRVRMQRLRQQVEQDTNLDATSAAVVRGLGRVADRIADRAHRLKTLISSADAGDEQAQRTLAASFPLAADALSPDGVGYDREAAAKAARDLEEQHIEVVQSAMERLGRVTDVSLVESAVEQLVGTTDDRSITKEDLDRAVEWFRDGKITLEEFQQVAEAWNRQHQTQR